MNRRELERLARRLGRATIAERRLALRGMANDDLIALGELWWLWAHPGQYAPRGNWRVWLIRAGRGFGKTRAGAEWINEIAYRDGNARIALVAATASEAMRVMVEGESGLLTIAPPRKRPRWSRSTGELHYPSGAVGYVYSAAAPEALRGPQHHAAWCDELAKWRYGETAWDNLMMGLRLGDRPRVVVTTTPKPVPLLRKVMAIEGIRQSVGRTDDNPHLPASYLKGMRAMYGGSRLGRQELAGELIEDHEGALWTRAMLDAARIAAGETVPGPVRVVVAVDPPASADGDACGIVAAGLDADGTGYVLEDASIENASPERWAAAVAACAARVGADRVVAEKNQGGAMVESVLRAADAGLPVRLVHASRGKVARAEPVAALYERGKVRHVRGLGALEDQLCGMVTGGVYAGPGRSPDRADALVWALTELMLGRAARATVRRM